MTRSRCAFAVLALATLGSTACRPPRPLPPRVLVTFVNDSAQRLCDIHMRLSAEAAAGWGTDWLDRSETVEPSQRRRLHVAPHKRWDIRVRGCDGAVLGAVKGLQIAGDVTLRVSKLSSLAR